MLSMMKQVVVVIRGSADGLSCVCNQQWTTTMDNDAAIKIENGNLLLECNEVEQAPCSTRLLLLQLMN